ncbi:MAG: hypothetical protein AAFY11_15470 [Cyanobacteria bacterium J06641_5]
MKPKFSTLIALTLLTAAFLSPFIFSPLYLPYLRETNFDLHELLQREIYKLVTGYVSLFLIVVEIALTARKRGRGWLVSLRLPGSMQIWRSVHIFVGVALVATTLVHTLGSHGLNFNATLLWVFFGVTLTALVGVVAETGLLEYPHRYLNLTFALGDAGKFSKGTLIKKLRGIWLTSHIILVNAFAVMLAFHIFLAYYYQ